MSYFYASVQKPRTQGLAPETSQRSWSSLYYLHSKAEFLHTVSLFNKVTYPLTKVTASTESWSSIIDSSRQMLQQSNGDVTVLEGQCFAQIPPRRVHTSSVWPKMTRKSQISRDSDSADNALQTIIHILRFIHVIQVITSQIQILLTSRMRSNRSRALMSHSRRSLISVKIHGLISAPRPTITPSTLPHSSFS